MSGMISSGAYVDPRALLDKEPIEVEVLDSFTDADVARRKQPQRLLEDCLHIWKPLQVAVLWHSVPPKRIHLLHHALILTVLIKPHKRFKLVPPYALQCWTADHTGIDQQPKSKSTPKWNAQNSVNILEVA